MRYTIKKMNQTGGNFFLPKGGKFYRVSRDGVYLQDFKTKKGAKSFITKNKKKNVGR